MERERFPIGAHVIVELSKHPRFHYQEYIDIPESCKVPGVICIIDEKDPELRYKVKFTPCLRYRSYILPNGERRTMENVWATAEMLSYLTGERVGGKRILRF